MAHRSSRFAWIAMSALAMSAIAASFCMQGCRKERQPEKEQMPKAEEQSPKYDRTKDAAYQQELLGEIPSNRNMQVKARRQTVADMRAVIAKARAALPEGAADEAVKAELEGNPGKYPEWKALNERIAKDNAAIAEGFKDAQARVRARLVKELGPQARPQNMAAARTKTKE